MMKVLTAQAIIAQLRAILGRDVAVGRSAQSAITKPALIVTYRGNGDAVTCLCLCDLPFAAHAAASLALFPASRALEAIRAGHLDEDLQDCFHEVMNVLAPLLTEHLGERVALQSVYEGARLPPEGKDWLRPRPPWHTELQVEVKGYGSGSLALLGVSQ